ncbi:MAG: alanine racemase [Candidatus Omnitrophica bacterium]|nr:alanine racemase [Candidatus Omnitrophota bacterium]
MQFYRPTWAEVNLGNLAYNFRQIKKMVSSGTKIMVTVKADAYGHGLIPVSKKLASLKVDFLGVASIDEGIKLRQAGIKIPILVLGLIFKKDAPALLRYRLTPTVCDLQIALALDKEARKCSRPINVHIKVDTGMGRIGVLHQEALPFIEEVVKLKHINIEGLFTHFPFADMDRDFTSYQIGLFNRLVNDLKNEGIRIPLVHSANSMGVIGYRESHFNMVRPGLAVYGLYPREDLNGIKLRPVLSLKTKVVYAKRVPGGFGLSYGHTYITEKPSSVVTLPIGYGDGYPRNLSNFAPVLIKGKRFRISGNICMDQVMVDVGDFAVKAGDEAVLIGSSGKEKITVEELATLSATIPYEIVCGLGSRIPRLYI